MSVVNGNQHNVELHQGLDGFWRWHIVNPENGQIVGTSNESFATRSNAKRAARRLCASDLIFFDRADHGGDVAQIVAG